MAVSWEDLVGVPEERVVCRVEVDCECSSPVWVQVEDWDGGWLTVEVGHQAEVVRHEVRHEDGSNLEARLAWTIWNALGEAGYCGDRDRLPGVPMSPF